jgi:hypothetical protein
MAVSSLGDPPQFPGQSVANFLQQYLTREPQPRPEVSLSWQEVYCLASPHEALLQALAASYPSTESYYQGILAAAATVGLKAPEVLLSVLWHAPQGTARQYPEGLGYLQKLVAAAQVQPNPATGSENVPWELLLDNARLQTRESSAGSRGPQRFLGKNRAQPPQPERAMRTPFSCRNFKGNLRKI